MLRMKRGLGARESLHRTEACALRVEPLESRLLFSVAYTVTDLGNLGGGAVPNGINNAGQIAGTSVAPDGTDRLFLWQKGKMTDLGTLVPGTSSLADGIASNGDIAGYGYLSSVDNAFFDPILDHNGKIQDLGILPGYSFSEAEGINAHDQVVGYANMGDPEHDDAFLYSNGKMIDLGPQVGALSNAYAINDAGTVVGYGTGANGNPDAFVYKNGKATFLGTPSGFGNSSEADAINSTGTEIVGNTGFYLEDASYAFVYKNGQFTTFNNLSLTYSNATGVNSSGVVVGDYEPEDLSSGDYSHAWVYQGSGSPVDLTDLIDPALGIKLSFAEGINDAGQIIASGDINGTAHAYLLNPVAPGSISGTVYNDLNGNGKRDAGDTGLAGRTVYIDANHNGVLDPSELSTTTDANGHYTFTGLAPGTYSISEVPVSDWHTTAVPTDIKLASGQNISGANIGNQQMLLYTLTDIAGPQVTIEATGFNAAGQVVGDYLSFDAGGNPTDYGFLYSDSHLTTLGLRNGDTNGLTINAAGQVNGHTTSAAGTPFYFRYSNGKLVPAVQPATYGDVINDHGDYAGDLVFPDDKGPTYTTAFVVIGGKTTVLGPTEFPDFSSQVFAINNLGQVLGDGQFTENGPDGPFLYSNGHIQWLKNVPESPADINDSGQIVGSFQTLNEYGGNDAYIYTGGQVIDLNDAIPANTGLSLTGATYINDAGEIVASAVDTANAQHLVLLTPVLGSVSGNVFNDVNHNGTQQAGEPPLAGIRVYADINNNHRWDPGEPFAVTNAAGQYTISGVPSDGVVIRQVLQPGWTQTSATNSVGTWADLSPGQNITISPFAQSAMPASVSGSVFNDINGDGIQETGEAGLADILVYVDLGDHHQFEMGDPFALTDAGGNYTLADLQPGNITIRSQTKVGVRQTTSAIGIVLHAAQQAIVPGIGQTGG